MFTMFKRMGLFFIINGLVVLTVSITLNFICAYFQIQLDGFIMPLIIYSILGMGGAFVSLWMSKGAAKRRMKLQIIDPNVGGSQYRWILDSVHHYSRLAQLPKMPEVGIYDSPEVNAFATGPTKSNSLVAVSTGLIQKMNKSEVEGVLGHEVAHIANGDMVTMTLLQGMMNTMVLFLASIIANIVSSNMRGENGRGIGGFFIQQAIYMAIQIPLSFLGSIVVNFFSRAREFRADAGSAKYAGREKMISALEALKNPAPIVDERHAAMAHFKISGQPSRFAALMSTHPTLENRIARLKRV